MLAGYLHGLDVGPVATATAYGAMPATLFASPGTAVRAAVVWVTVAQATQLTWSELSYHLARLETAHFVADREDVDVDGLFAYVSRLGSFCVDGEPVALAALPARDRTAAAYTQEQLLDLIAPEMIGAGARAEDLVRAIFEDMLVVGTRASEVLWPRALKLAPEHWTRFPA